MRTRGPKTWQSLLWKIAILSLIVEIATSRPLRNYQEKVEEKAWEWSRSTTIRTETDQRVQIPTLSKASSMKWRRYRPRARVSWTGANTWKRHSIMSWRAAGLLMAVRGSSTTLLAKNKPILFRTTWDSFTKPNMDRQSRPALVRMSSVLCRTRIKCSQMTSVKNITGKNTTIWRRKQDRITTITTITVWDNHRAPITILGIDR